VQVEAATGREHATNRCAHVLRRSGHPQVAPEREAEMAALFVRVGLIVARAKKPEGQNRVKRFVGVGNAQSRAVSEKRQCRLSVRVLPNPALKGRSNGVPPGPEPRYGVHFLFSGPGVPPSASPLARTLGSTLKQRGMPASQSKCSVWQPLVQFKSQRLSVAFAKIVATPGACPANTAALTSFGVRGWRQWSAQQTSTPTYGHALSACKVRWAASMWQEPMFGSYYAGSWHFGSVRSINQRLGRSVCPRARRCQPRIRLQLQSGSASVVAFPVQSGNVTNKRSAA
jgi:hypothetical protein